MKMVIMKLGLGVLVFLLGLVMVVFVVVDKVDNVFMMICIVLVLFMIILGIVLFYGGLICGKNVLFMLIQVIVIFGLVCVLWVIYGYILVFGIGGSFFGSFDWVMLKNIELKVLMGIFYQYIYVVFQGLFVCIIVGLIVGVLVECICFFVVLIFVVVWMIFFYVLIVYMVWGGGLLVIYGVLDFVGGIVVYINVVVVGLVGVYMMGKCVGFGKEVFKLYNLLMVFIGIVIFYVGWFGFNVGFVSVVNEIVVLVFVNIVVVIVVVILVWIFGEWVLCGKFLLLGVCFGVIVGLVGVMLVCGYIGVGGVLIVGIVFGLVGIWGVIVLKCWLCVDDFCDVFGVYGVCGIVGCILIGIFVVIFLGGVGYVEGVIMGYQLLV